MAYKPEVKEKFYDKVMELKNEWLTNREIQEKVKSELWHNLWLWTISRWTSDLVQQLNQVEKKKKYDIIEVDWEKVAVIFFKKKSWEKWVYNIPVVLIEKITYMFSRNGKNMSTADIADELGMEYHALKAVMNAFEIYKASNIVPNVKLEELETKWGESAVIEYINHMTENAVVDKYKNTYKETYKAAFLKQWQKAMKQVAEREALSEQIIDNIKQTGFPKLPAMKEHKLNESDYTIESITDLHIGKNDTQAILDNLSYIWSVIKAKPQKVVYLEILWDLGEAFINMHPGQIEWMDWPFWFDLVTYIEEVLAHFLQDLSQTKKVYVKGIWGNHDRFTQKNEDSPKRTAALVIYRLLQYRLQNNKNVDIEYHDKPGAMVYTVWGLTRILTHEPSARKLSDMILQYGDTSKYNFVIHTHLHTAMMKEQNDKWVSLSLAALAWSWEYDKSKHLSSNIWWHSTAEITVWTKKHIQSIFNQILKNPS